MAASFASYFCSQKQLATLSASFLWKNNPCETVLAWRLATRGLSMDKVETVQAYVYLGGDCK